MKTTDCCVVGAGPAGAVLALLLARQGIRVTLLEAHADFDRDFRGDALQPAALDLIGQMGLAQALFNQALSTHAVFPLHTAAGTLPFLDVSRLRTPYPFIAMVPQSRLLELIVAEADRLPTFERVMGAHVKFFCYITPAARSAALVTAIPTDNTNANMLTGATGRRR